MLMHGKLIEDQQATIVFDIRFPQMSSFCRLSVWSNGVTITPEGANEKPTTGESQDVQRSSSTFYPIVGLHYCAAVRYDSGDAHSPHSPHPSNPHDVRFVPLDSLAGRATDGAAHPPIFAAIFRRTTGVKVSLGL